jgi:ferredoxin, 2Fe-2S
MADWIHGTAGASMAKMVVTDRDGNVHVVEGRVGVKLMETLREFDYGVTAICGGLCSCATCHVFVKPEWMGRLPAPQGDEKELLVELQNYDAPSSRLSCQVDFTEALDGLELKIAPDE